MKIRDLIGCLLLTLLLSGCSPHPGSGSWMAVESSHSAEGPAFVQLNVMYDGRTDIFDRKAEEGAAPRTAVRRCFWHGSDASTIELTCVHADNADVEESFQLRVAPDQNAAELTQGGRVIGRYRRVTGDAALGT